jgi:tetratricopeptide (TPR) repeat protein
MCLRLGVVAIAVVLFVTAQVPSESNNAYRRYLAARFTPDGVKAAEDWLQTYERQPPDPKNVPPYLELARFYSDRGVHRDEVPALLDEAAREIVTAGSFTDIRARTNSPFEDDISRCLAANVHIKIGQYDKAHALLEAARKTIADTQTERFAETKMRIFEALLFGYRDAMVRLGVAESRKEDALNVARTILTNPKNVASSRLLEEHRAIARQLWRDLGRTEDTFEQWLSARN